MDMPKSEQICMKNLYPDCPGCDEISYGWDYSGAYDNEETIIMYHVTNENLIYNATAEKIAKNFGYKNLQDLGRTAKMVMSDYLKVKERSFFLTLPPMKYTLKHNKSIPTIELKESGIMVWFFVEPKGFFPKFYENRALEFVVGHLHTVNNGGFKLIAQYIHP